MLRMNLRELELYRDRSRQLGDIARNYRIEYNNFYPVDVHLGLLRLGMATKKIDGVFGAVIVKARMNYTFDLGFGVNGGVLREGNGVLIGPSMSIHYDDFLSFQLNAGINLKKDTLFIGGNFVFTPMNVRDAFKVGLSLGAVYDGKDVKAQTGFIFPIGGTPDEGYWKKLKEKTFKMQEEVLAMPPQNQNVKYTKAGMRTRQAMDYDQTVKQGKRY